MNFCSIPWQSLSNFYLFSMASTKVIEIQPILGNIGQFFQVILAIFTLNILTLREFNEILWEFTKVYKSLWYSMKLKKILSKIIHFCSFAFTICDFKIWPHNFGFTQTVLNFQTCLWWKLKSQYRIYLASGCLNLR